MKKRVIHILIIYCSKQAYKYDKMSDMLVKQDMEFRLFYAVGTMIINRDKWLKRIFWLQKFVTKIRTKKL